MGQLIEVEHTVLGNVAIFDTDRSLSGSEGETFTTPGEAAASITFPAQLAVALFEAEPGIGSVYVYSNAISIKRSGEWAVSDARQTAEVIRNFLIYYDENRD